MAILPNPILDEWIQAGKPTKEEIFQNLKANQEYFNDEIEQLKGTASVDIFDLQVSGRINDYNEAELQERLPVFKAPTSASITSVVITLLEASTSGTLEVELERSTDNGATWVPLLSSPVQVTGLTVGSISGAVNWVDVSSQDFNQNDLLRPVVSGLQVNQGSFHISVYGELA